VTDSAQASCDTEPYIAQGNGASLVQRVFRSEGRGSFLQCCDLLQIECIRAIRSSVHSIRRLLTLTSSC